MDKNIIILADTCIDDPWDIRIHEFIGESEFDDYLIDIAWSNLEDDLYKKYLELSDRDLIEKLHKDFNECTVCTDWYHSIYYISTNSDEKTESYEYRAGKIRETLNWFLTK